VTGEIRGVVNDRKGTPLSWVSVAATDSTGRVAGVMTTSDDGEFTFSQLPAGVFTIEATLLGVPAARPRIDAKVAAKTGDSGLRLEVDRGEELSIGIEKGTFLRTAPSVDVGVLEIETKAGRVRYSGALDRGNVAFRRIQTGLPWTLWIPWSKSTNGTLYETGATLKAGTRTVALEPGGVVKGRIKFEPNGPWPTFGGSHSEWLRATRGPAKVEGYWNRDGEFAFDPLASGTWKLQVTLVRPKDQQPMSASVDVQPGGPPVIMEPLPVK
jgi:hypothetical protein